jgi:hypothetical protein
VSDRQGGTTIVHRSNLLLDAEKLPHAYGIAGDIQQLRMLALDPADLLLL